MQIDEANLPSMDDLISQHVDLSKVKKIGEGTFGEAFKSGDVVLKIVPMDGATLVNGETQKRAEEIFAEVSVALTLNQLRSPIGQFPYVSICFGLTKERLLIYNPCSFQFSAFTLLQTRQMQKQVAQKFCDINDFEAGVMSS